MGGGGEGEGGGEGHCAPQRAHHLTCGTLYATCACPEFPPALVPLTLSPTLACTYAAVGLGSVERMVAFCRAVQQSSPIGSYIQPEPGQRR